MFEDKSLTVGADPEFFVRVKNHFVSGHHFELGTKDDPQKVMFGAVQNDGLAVEINIAPARNSDEFAHNMRKVKEELLWILHLHVPGATLAAKPSVFFGQRYLSKLPAGVAELGCQPDFDAYTRQINPRPNKAAPFRTGAGHVHLGWATGGRGRSRGYIQECSVVAQQLDYYLGLPSLLWDKDSRRRSLYGRAGCFRPKPYGLEYRTLSNAWCDDDTLIRFVFNQTKKCFTDVQNGVLMTDRFGYAARDFINSNDYEWRRKAPRLAKELQV
jgi:hypothetical protein